MSLPAEIRLMILEAVRHQINPGWASLASVCKEWQIFIEAKNFHTLQLKVSCLDDLECMVVRQRDLVRHISFNIELARYTCRSCKREESESWESRNSAIVSKGVWKLFTVLSTWKSSTGLTLELNAYSPSDSDHWFKDYHFASGDEGNEDTTSLQEYGSGWHDPKHGWIKGQRARTPPHDAVLRLFSQVDPRFRKGLPEVNVVSCFIIRRQLRRRLCSWAFLPILDKLCRLEHIVYEPWRPWQSWRRDLLDKRSIPIPKAPLFLILTSELQISDNWCEKVFPKRSRHCQFLKISTTISR